MSTRAGAPPDARTGVRLERPDDRQTIFQVSRPGRRASSLPACDVPERPLDELVPQDRQRTSPARLPEVAEVDLVRHYTMLSTLNYGVESGPYPLGSCTMKYNPKVNEWAFALEGFAGLHPYQHDDQTQGALALLKRLECWLAEIAGLHAATLQPAAGAHGEMTGLLLMRAYHAEQGREPRKIVIPDSAHGTNPASVVLSGYQPVAVRSDARGGVDLDALHATVDDNTAGLMLTNPNTLGLFDEHIVEIAELVHQVGGLLYYDGANTNAVMGRSRPGDMGFDIVHFNAHKSFSTPHGGGGPGAGPVAVRDFLEPYLPVPVIVEDVVCDAEEPHEGFADECCGVSLRFEYDRPRSIGKMRTFYGNFGVLVRAYAYIRALGGEGLRRVSDMAVLNANYVLQGIRDLFEVPYDRRCMHEFVVSGEALKEHGVKTLDVAKRLLDYGMHPPTTYFPLIVPEALMVEPTETESKESLDCLIAAFRQIVQEARTQPELLREAPRTMPVRRLDEVRAVRQPVLRERLD
jgi:glycine dehydrogenase subunit 2